MDMTRTIDKLRHSADDSGVLFRPDESLFILVICIILIFLSLLGVKMGAETSSWKEIFAALLRQGSAGDLEYFIYYLRLPKVVAAIFVGASLATSGVILQNVLNNPLASSFTLGLSQGAAFGASFSMVVLASLSIKIGLSLVVLGALTGAFIAAFFILIFSLIRGMTPQGLILAGIALSTFFGAATMAIQYFATDSEVAATVFWSFGDLSKGSWREACLTGLVFIAGLAFALRNSFNYDVLRWGDEQALALGVNVKSLRFFSILTASLITAFATAFYGVIGFVGLVAPHMIRLIFPHAKHFFLLVASSLFGASFLLCADLIAQRVLYPILLPIGIICAFTGVPVFLFLLFKRSLKNA